ncbi:MAG: NAD(P)/FAD-dependent oxidoreductase [Verrucomicrobia bacterium]|nr:NAD(P)/FAD-dependent oxidoreductase [Verrucomicrobiota bacterium]
MSSRQIIVVGGGAAGVFAAIACAEAMPEAEVTVLEKGPEFLGKVRISGGGRCNVTHACFDPRELASRYPRGGRALIGPFKRFQPRDTAAWFEARGVKLKTERDGRMFPVSDDSQTVVDCLVRAAKAVGVKLRARCGVERVTRRAEGGFNLALAKTSCRPTGRGDTPVAQDDHQSGDKNVAAPSYEAESLVCDRLLLAMGGCRTAAAAELAVSLGHTLEPPVPSLFTFHVATSWLRELSGISVEPVEASVPGTKLRERGALLMTHWGLSGPAILRLSAWGARELHGLDYKFPLHINWLPRLSAEAVAAELQARRDQQSARFVANTPIPPLPARLWERLVLAAGIGRETRWAALPRAAQHGLVQQLIRTEFPVTGKSMNKDEFVTCGGVRLGEVDFKTMESRICPGLYFAGELLDVDGITGGFNFQAAWTTGWIAGRAMAA